MVVFFIFIKTEKFIHIFLTIAICVFVTACSDKNDNNASNSYRFGVLYTSNINSKSEIKLFTPDWKLVKTISLDVGGINTAYKYKDIIYMPITGTPTNPESRILIFNLKTLNTSYVKTLDLPMKISVDENFAYVIHNSTMTSGILTKIDLNKNKIVKRLELKGFPRDVRIVKNNIYVISDNIMKKSQTIYKINKQLDKPVMIYNNLTSVANDSLFINGNLYIMNMSNKDHTGPTDQLTIINPSSKKLQMVQLKTTSPYQIFDLGSEKAVIHFDPIAMANATVSILDSNNITKEQFDLKKLAYKSHIYNNFLYTTDLNKINIYDMKKFELQTSNQLPIDKNMVVVDFFAK
jgi:hypothetical protein